MADTGTSAGEYLGLLNTRARQVLDCGRPSSYPQSLAMVTRLAFDKLRADDPASASLAGMCAFLASEPLESTPQPCFRLDSPAPPRIRRRGTGCWPGSERTRSPGSIRTGLRDAPAHPSRHTRPSPGRAGLREPAGRRGDNRCQPSRRRTITIHMAGMGAASASPAIPRPRPDLQPGPPESGDRRYLGSSSDAGTGKAVTTWPAACTRAGMSGLVPMTRARFQQRKLARLPCGNWAAWTRPAA